MPRGDKRGANRGKSHRGLSRGWETSFVQSSGTSTPHRGFTLAEEARNTEEHPKSYWNSPLRYGKVSFVSAGSLANPDSKQAESALAHMSLDSHPQDTQEDIHIHVEGDAEEDKNEQFEDAPSPLHHRDPTASIDPSNFIIDTHGDQSISTGLPPPRIRSPSPAPSNSSEEVILFGGRNNLGKAIPRSTQGSETAPSTNPFDVKIQAVEDEIHLREEFLESLHRKMSLPSFCEELMTKQSTSSKYSGDSEPVVPGRRNRNQGRRSKQKEAEQDPVLADYLANMDSEDKEILIQGSVFNARELGGTDDEPWQDEIEMSSREPHVSKEHLKGGWDSNIEDLDDLSTSDGVIGEVQAIFSKRERKSGLQYLVVWEDQTMDDARWVPATTLTSVSAQAHIEGFELEEKLVAQFAAVSDEEDNDSSMDGELTTDEEAEDEKDLLQRKIDRMDDKQIARLLAEQEELGMGSKELLLFDDAADADEEDGFTLPNRSLNPFMLPSQKKNRSKRPIGEFPAATALADAYDGFNVMDFDRPSLKKKPKGRKGKLILDDVDDSELEESMQAAWNSDRIKKKERKQEREELRARGLLGSKNGKPDLKQKYKEGMGIESIKDEIKSFLMSSNTTLSLPPMDKAYRKIVHEIANAFNLKSKSAGTGNNRFPILYRTSRTFAFIERTWSEVDARVTRRYLPRSDVGRNKWPKSGGAKKPGRGGGGFNNAAVSYRDGDEVGGSAPELGAENRGRAMLEKMGWSHGTALGAENNKGILKPISHVVKNTRAGLG